MPDAFDFCSLLREIFQEREELNNNNSLNWSGGKSSDEFKKMLALLSESYDLLKTYLHRRNVNWGGKKGTGSGGMARDLYLTLLPPNQETSDGIYVSFCFSRDGSGCVFGCSTSVKDKKILPDGIVTRANAPKGDKNNNPWTMLAGFVIDVRKYNNSFFNPLEISRKEVEDNPAETNAKILKHLNESIELCQQKIAARATGNAPAPTPAITPDVRHDNAGTDITAMVSSFLSSCRKAGLQYSPALAGRFIAALAAKPFVILTGLSGSGKTKLAQAFVRFISADDSQYLLVPVGADWINNEHLLGFADALNPGQYVPPETGVLNLLMYASQNKDKTCFLILDEMNLSHVERYFADFLSAMESKEPLRLYQGGQRTDSHGNEIPASLKWPDNLRIIGTMNVDETTYMFSPKVLDRAQVIEFRVSPEDMEEYLYHAKPAVDLDKLNNAGKDFAAEFKRLADAAGGTVDLPDVKAQLCSWFEELGKCSAEFGYRTAGEILRFIQIAAQLNFAANTAELLDYAIMQKLLPKLHGSAMTLKPVLLKLAFLCFEKGAVDEKDEKTLRDRNTDKVVLLPVSLDKIRRMLDKAENDGFASYPEA